MPANEFPAPDVEPEESGESRRRRYEEFKAEIAAGQSDVKFVRADKKKAQGRSMLDDAKANEGTLFAAPAKPEEISNRERRDTYSKFMAEARPQRSDFLSEVDQGAIDKGEEKMQATMQDEISALVGRAVSGWIEGFKRDYKPPQDIELEDKSGPIDE